MGKQTSTKIKMVVLAIWTKGEDYIIAARKLHNWIFSFTVEAQHFILVADEEGNGLKKQQLLYNDECNNSNEIVAPLDIIEVSIFDYKFQEQQPERRRVDKDQPLSYLGTFGDVKELNTNIETLWINENKRSIREGFNNTTDGQFLESESIYVICPSEFEMKHFYMKYKNLEEHEYLAKFNYNGHRYIMDITDEKLRAKLDLYDINKSYTLDFKCLICVSLGPPLKDGKRYKYVASVIPNPGNTVDSAKKYESLPLKFKDK